MAIKDYNRARSYLIDLANRERVPVFDNVEEAVKCVVHQLRKNHNHTLWRTFCPGCRSQANWLSYHADNEALWTNRLTDWFVCVWCVYKCHVYRGILSRRRTVASIGGQNLSTNNQTGATLQWLISILLHNILEKWYTNPYFNILKMNGNRITFFSEVEHVQCGISSFLVVLFRRKKPKLLSPSSALNYRVLSWFIY